MDDKYTIDEMSKFTGVSKHTLRYYEKIGLIVPTKRNPNNNYRYYSYTHLKRIKLIQELKNMNFSLKEIEYYTNSSNLIYLDELIQEKQLYLLKQIELLKASYVESEKLIVSILLAKNPNKEFMVTIKDIEHRYCYNLEHSFTINELFSEIKSLYFSYISDSKNTNLLHRGKVLIEILKEDLGKGLCGRYSSIGFFVENAEENEDVKKILGGKYATCYHFGDYSGIHHTYAKLLEYIKNHKYKICGNSIETALVHQTITDIADEYITEIQIPIIP